MQWPIHRSLGAVFTFRLELRLVAVLRGRRFLLSMGG